MMKLLRAEAILDEVCVAVSKWLDYAEQARVMNDWRQQMQNAEEIFFGGTAVIWGVG